MTLKSAVNGLLLSDNAEAIAVVVVVVVDKRCLRAMPKRERGCTAILELARLIRGRRFVLRNGCSEDRGETFWEVVLLNTSNTEEGCISSDQR